MCAPHTQTAPPRNRKGLSAFCGTGCQDGRLTQVLACDRVRITQCTELIKLVFSQLGAFRTPQMLNRLKAALLQTNASQVEPCFHTESTHMQYARTKGLPTHDTALLRPSAPRMTQHGNNTCRPPRKHTFTHTSCRHSPSPKRAPRCHKGRLARVLACDHVRSVQCTEHVRCVPRRMGAVRTQQMLNCV